MSNVLRLTCLNSRYRNNQWDIVAYARVGRGDNLELVLSDPTVSRVHATIDSENGWRVTDLRSTNGTFLNGIRLGNSRGGATRADSVLLQDRDVLQFGKVALLVEVRDAADVSKPRLPHLPETCEEGSDPGYSTHLVGPTRFGSAKPTTPEEVWYGARNRHPGLLVLVRVGDHFESFHDDAEKVAAVCGLPLLAGSAKRCRLPAAALDKHLDLLMEHRLRMVVCDRSTEIRVGIPQECLAPAMHDHP